MKLDRKHKTYSLWIILLMALMICSVAIGSGVAKYVRDYEKSFLSARLHDQNRYALQLMAAGGNRRYYRKGSPGAADTHR